MEHPPSSSPELLKSLEQEMDDDLHPVLRWIVDHLNALGLGVAAILLAVTGFTAFQHYREIQLSRAQEALARLTQAPPTPQTVRDLKAMAQDEAGIRTAALLAAIAHAEALDDTDQAAVLWSQVATTSENFRPVATLGQVHALLRAGQFTEALALTEQTDWPPAFRPLVLSAKAFAFEGAGQPTQAIAAYRELTTLIPQSPYLDAKIAQLERQVKS